MLEEVAVQRVEVLFIKSLLEVEPGDVDAFAVERHGVGKVRISDFVIIRFGFVIFINLMSLVFVITYIFGNLPRSS